MIKKSWFWTIIIVIIAIVVIIGATKLGLWVNFMLGNDIVITLNAPKEIYNLKNGQQDDVKFDLKVTANPFCVAQCNSYFKSLSNNQIIKDNIFTIRTGLSHSDDFVIEPKTLGEGKEFYQYYVSCKGVKTTWCHSKEQETSRTFLITLNHNLSGEEILLRDSLKNTVQKDNLQFETSKQQYNYILELNTNKSNKLKFNRYDEIKIEISYQTENSNKLWNEIKTVWNDQNYDSLAQKSTEFGNNIKLLSYKIEQLKENMNTESQRYNQALINTHNNLIITKQLLNDTLMLNTVLSATINNSITYINGLIDDINSPINATEAERLDGEITAQINYLNQSKIDILRKESLILNLNKDILCNVSKICLNHSNFKSRQKEIDLNVNETCTQIIEFNSLVDFADQQTRLNITEVNSSRFTSLSNLKINMSDKCIVGNYTALKELSVNTIILNNNLPVLPETALMDQLPKCCLWNNCSTCNENQDRYPIIFLHGHAFNSGVSADYSLDAFNQIQQELENEGYLSAGSSAVYTHDINELSWVNVPKPITLRVSYYYDFMEESDKVSLVQTKSDSIDSYSIKLKEAVEWVKLRTNQPKVIIIAHSMGGLVARRYVQNFGPESVDKLILVGTPNKGIVGKVSDLCSFIGEGLECRDMQEGSLFLNKLNRNKDTVPVYTIIGKGCDSDGKDSDGIVLVDKSTLEWADNYYITGSCTATEFMHTDLLNVDMYPKVYKRIVEILK